MNRLNGSLLVLFLFSSVYFLLAKESSAFESDLFNITTPSDFNKVYTFLNSPGTYVRSIWMVAHLLDINNAIERDGYYHHLTFCSSPAFCFEKKISNTLSTLAQTCSQRVGAHPPSCCIGQIKIEKLSNPSKSFTFEIKIMPQQTLSDPIRVYNSCMIKLIMHQDKNALVCFKKLKQTHPEFPYAYMGLANYYYKKKQFSKALRLYGKFLFYMHGHPGLVRKYIADTLFQLKKYKAASDWYEQFIEDPNDYVCSIDLEDGCCNLIDSSIKAKEYLKALAFQKKCEEYASWFSPKQRTRYLTRLNKLIQEAKRKLAIQERTK